MDRLSIRHKTYAKFRKGIGILFIILGIFYTIMVIKKPDILHLVLGIFWILMGIAYYMTSSGSNISSVVVDKDELSIKWINWFRVRTFRTGEIIRIVLKRTEILIYIKDRKQVRLPIDFFELEDRKEAYMYFIELCRQKNLSFEKADSGL